MTFIEERVREIEHKYAYLIQDLLILRLTEETLKLVLILNDGTTMRVTERWRGGRLIRYSYYWLDTENKLKVGWDNSPHHKRLENFPHHKHIGEQGRREASFETCLEDVMAIVEKEVL
mgnify:CR=1 FL=1